MKLKATKAAEAMLAPIKNLLSDRYYGSTVRLAKKCKTKETISTAWSYRVVKERFVLDVLRKQEQGVGHGPEGQQELAVYQQPDVLLAPIATKP